ncbi:MAG TPA: phospholipid carrier-dependent glycosyltransferase, partial [Dehalococcoidia bacterium]|nr:phospholipid carrier-dependent glycosyltransferase [Dehalococcoidia bacterium]
EESALPQSELREGPPATFPPYPTRPGLRPFPPPILRTASSTEQGTSGPRALAKGRVLGLSIEMVAILALVLFFLVAALWGLGSLNMPTSNWTPRSGQESLYLDTGAPADVRNLFFLVQGPEPVKVEASCGQPGAWQVQANNSSEGNWHSWRQIALSCQTRYVRLAFQDSRAAIGEVALFSGAQQLPLQSVVSESASPGVDALRDEQGLVRTPPTYREGSYFDEIYFVRTAEEHIGLKEPFEWTHPPLGKLVIAGGILYLGDRPVAWRLPGVALAALVIPIVYLLARRMFGTVRAGLIATALITFEFMHFTEARLATAEISLFFWIALTFYFFYRYYQPAAEVAPAGPASGWRMLLPRGRDWDLFLAMVFFGLAFATKWIAAYGLVGILILLLGLKVRERHVTAGEIVALAAGAAAAGLIYLLSYVPYLMAGHDLSDLVELQRSMYRYHSTLTATHPYSSPWWSWPFLLKPLWLANNRVDGDASMVVTLGNPALWLVGPFLIVLTAGLFLKLRDRRLAFIVVPFLTQWLFFVPIGRVLFIYHFFPNVLIMVLAATLWLEILWQRWQWPVWGYLALNAFLFLIFYPVLSGYPVAPTYWNDVRGLLPPPLG